MSDWVAGQIGLATTADHVAWAVGLGALAVYLLPYAVTAAGVRIVRFRAVADPTLAEPDGTDDGYRDRFDELTALGFRPAGVIRETMWLNMADPWKRFDVRELRSADGRTVASLYRLFGSDPVRVALHSRTADGVLVQTVMPGAGIPHVDDDHRRSEQPWQPVADLLAHHDAQVAQAGLPVDLDLDQLAAADEALTRRQMAGIGLGDVRWRPVHGWLVPFAVSAGGTLLWSSAPAVRAVSVGLVAAGACYWVYAFRFMPAYLSFLLRVEAACGAEPEEAP